MGRLTGRLKLDPELPEHQAEVIRTFSKTRHGGQEPPSWITDEAWCHWSVSQDCKFLVWDDKSSDPSVAWLHHLNRKFFTRWQVVMSGKVSWTECRTKRAISATPVTRPDGIRTTEIRPPTEVLDKVYFEPDISEHPETVENAFIIFPPVCSLSDEDSILDFESLQLGRPSDANAWSSYFKPLLGVVRPGGSCGWKAVRERPELAMTSYIRWEGGDELTGCREWLEYIAKMLRAKVDFGRLNSHVLIGKVRLPDGEVIEAKPARDGVLVHTEISILSAEAQDPRGGLQLVDPKVNQNLNVFTLFGSATFDYILRVKDFVQVRHGNEESTWIVPSSLVCGWKPRFHKGVTFIEWGGGNALNGCVHWLHHLYTTILAKMDVLMIGSVKLPNGLVITAEVARTGKKCWTRITPRMPVYDYVRDEHNSNNSVNTVEVDPTGWNVKWTLSCKVSCGWEGEQHEVRARGEGDSTCPKCRKMAIWTRTLAPPDHLVAGKKRPEAGGSRPNKRKKR